MKTIDLVNISVSTEIKIFPKRKLLSSEMKSESSKKSATIAFKTISKLNDIEMDINTCYFVEYDHRFLDNPSDYKWIHPQCLKAVDTAGVECFINLQPMRYLPAVLFEDKKIGDEVIIRFPIWLRVGDRKARIQDTYADVHFVLL